MARQQEQKRQQELLDQSVKKMMNDDSGRRVLTWLLNETGVYRTSIDQQPIIMGYNEGKREIGLKIMKQLQVHPGSYMKMLQKNLEEDQINEKIKGDDNEIDE